MWGNRWTLSSAHCCAWVRARAGPLKGWDRSPHSCCTWMSISVSENFAIPPALRGVYPPPSTVSGASWALTLPFLKRSQWNWHYYPHHTSGETEAPKSPLLNMAPGFEYGDFWTPKPLLFPTALPAFPSLITCL